MSKQVQWDIDKEIATVLSAVQAMSKQPGKSAEFLVDTSTPGTTIRGTRSKYRSTSGLTCPIGSLIPDDRYDSKVEFNHLGDCTSEYLVGELEDTAIQELNSRASRGRSIESLLETIETLHGVRYGVLAELQTAYSRVSAGTLFFYRFVEELAYRILRSPLCARWGKDRLAVVISTLRSYTTAGNET
jgi:hypothetical protein